MVKETKRKFYVLHEDVQATIEELNRLENLEPKERTVSSFKKQNELILVDRELATTVYADWSFTGLSDEDLQYIKVVTFYETESAYIFDSNFNYECDVYWKRVGNLYKLRIRMFGYQGTIMTNIPIYLTIKLLFFNNRVYQNIQHMRS